MFHVFHGFAVGFNYITFCTMFTTYQHGITIFLDIFL